MRRCISEPTIRFPRPAPRSVATSAFTTPGALIRALTGRRQTMLTSLACRTSWQAGPGRRSTYQNRNAVQTNRATADFNGILVRNGIAISMDGKGAWRDNVFIERVWRSVKYEEVYLRAYDTVSEPRASIGLPSGFSTDLRPHSSLDRQTPDYAYFTLDAAVDPCALPPNRRI